MNQRDMTDEDRAAMRADIQRAAAQRVNSAGDDRTANNAVRHSYRVLSDTEKAQMVAIKDKGAEFITLIDGLRAAGAPNPAYTEDDRELNIAAERVEEAVMWAVKHLTA